jgi:hypothetical protein
LTRIPPRDATGIRQCPHYVTAKPQAVATVNGREQLQGLKLWAKQTLGWTIEVVKHWWINFNRRHLLYGDDMPE